MTRITYTIVEHDGGWAYKVGTTYSEIVPLRATRRDRRPSGRRANSRSRASRPTSPGRTSAAAGIPKWRGATTGPRPTWRARPRGSPRSGPTRRRCRLPAGCRPGGTSSRRCRRRPRSNAPARARGRLAASPSCAWQSAWARSQAGPGRRPPFFSHQSAASAGASPGGGASAAKSQSAGAAMPLQPRRAATAAARSPSPRTLPMVRAACRRKTVAGARLSICTRCSRCSAPSVQLYL